MTTDQKSDKSTEELFEATLRRMLKTPPKHKQKPKQNFKKDKKTHQ